PLRQRPRADRQGAGRGVGQRLDLGVGLGDQLSELAQSGPEHMGKEIHTRRRRTGVSRGAEWTAQAEPRSAALSTPPSTQAPGAIKPRSRGHGGIGRRKRLKIARARPVRVRVPVSPPASTPEVGPRRMDRFYSVAQSIRERVWPNYCATINGRRGGKFPSKLHVLGKIIFVPHPIAVRADVAGQSECYGRIAMVATSQHSCRTLSSVA
ncbi:MAG: hypothetical protein JWP86_468, partial [Phenylobacterium sp.]|nr:hypothetical protein [Phenylobacterium sp.]